MISLDFLLKPANGNINDPAFRKVGWVFWVIQVVAS